RCPVTSGIPVKPMLASPEKSMHKVWKRFENQTVACEYKYDGERIQVHLLPGGAVKLFSRNSEETTGKFPDVRALFPDRRSAIIDCEVVAWDEEKNRILPFQQVLSKRKRKDVILADVKVKACVFAFDLLALNGRNIMHLPFIERRKLLQESFKALPGRFQFATATDVSTEDEMEKVFFAAVQDACEGLMVKSLNGPASAYVPDKRSHEWLKVKKDYIDGLADSFDLVVMAAWEGRGRRAGTFGAFLLGSYNQERDRYESVCKVGTGFTDAKLELFTNILRPQQVPTRPVNFEVLMVGQPHVWLDPREVWEVEAADMSLSPAHKSGAGDVDESDKGVALRFPRFIRLFAPLARFPQFFCPPSRAFFRLCAPLPALYQVVCPPSCTFLRLCPPPLPRFS
ncbi:ATP dependent DNA ligase domain-containing protein, partial [Baffinella frigidus]